MAELAFPPIASASGELRKKSSRLSRGAVRALVVGSRRDPRGVLFPLSNALRLFGRPAPIGRLPVVAMLMLLYLTVTHGA